MLAALLASTVPDIDLSTRELLDSVLEKSRKGELLVTELADQLGARNADDSVAAAGEIEQNANVRRPFRRSPGDRRGLGAIGSAVGDGRVDPFSGRRAGGSSGRHSQVSGRRHGPAFPGRHQGLGHMVAAKPGQLCPAAAGRPGGCRNRRGRHALLLWIADLRRKAGLCHRHLGQHDGGSAGRRQARTDRRRSPTCARRRSSPSSCSMARWTFGSDS